MRLDVEGFISDLFCHLFDTNKDNGFSNATQPYKNLTFGGPSGGDPCDRHSRVIKHAHAASQFGRWRPSAGRKGVGNRIHNPEYIEFTKLYNDRDIIR